MNESRLSRDAVAGAKSDSDRSPTHASLRIAAMNLLARREHSRAELAEKLGRKLSGQGDYAELLNEVLDRLSEDGLQCDRRFTEAFLRSRCNKGQGPRRIIQELGRCGVESALVNEVLSNSEIDWYEQARLVAIKKYGEEPPKDMRDRARRMRFLQYRGFQADQIGQAIESA
ncbi:MAG TPA: hypothetical protein DIT58_12660 [Porticoccaceae bacterium]|nr:hypothetical protein [Porticoccaceae bacterium]